MNGIEWQIEMTRYNEIGSEFCKENNGISLPSEIIPNSVSVLSGRTAIDFIIKDIKAIKKFQTILLPSYCCESMIEPFLRNEVKVIFYNIGIESIDVDFSNKCDAILLLDYFGFQCEQITNIAKIAKSKGIIVIYDSTHKIDGNKALDEYMDYKFCSHRKWYYCNFADVEKFNGNFVIDVPKSFNFEYLSLREKAADLKSEYILGKDVDKNVFLRLFAEAEILLESDYVGYAGIKQYYNLNLIKETRRRNAQILIHELRNLDSIRFWKENLTEDDTPLFFPIFLENSDRNALRSYLISNGIYCPIHWPVCKMLKENNQCFKIYDEEISLICDQRYGAKEMEREAYLIKKFFR